MKTAASEIKENRTSTTLLRKGAKDLERKPRFCLKICAHSGHRAGPTFSRRGGAVLIKNHVRQHQNSNTKSSFQFESSDPSQTLAKLENTTQNWKPFKTLTIRRRPLGQSLRNLQVSQGQGRGAGRLSGSHRDGGGGRSSSASPRSSRRPGGSPETCPRRHAGDAAPQGPSSPKPHTSAVDLSLCLDYALKCKDTLRPPAVSQGSLADSELKVGPAKFVGLIFSLSFFRPCSKWPCAILSGPAATQTNT